MRIALLVVLSLVLASPASAHIGAGAGQTDILLRDGSEDVWMKAPWGYVFRAGQDEWRWVCHEVFSGGNDSLLPDLSLSEDGVLLGVVGLLGGVVVEGVSLYRSVDGGCSWQPTVGLEGRVVVRAAFDPEDPQVALAITADLDTGEGVPPNGIARSVDGGATWTMIQEWDARLMRAVRFGVSGRAWVLSVQVEPPQAWLLRSDDGGLNWQELPTPTDGVETVLVGGIPAVSPTDADSVWLNFDGSDADALFRSSDGGSSFAPVTGIPAAFLDLTVEPDGTQWLVGGEREVFRSSDGSNWEQIEAPQSWGGAVDDRGLWLAANTLADDRAVVRLGPDGVLVDELPTLDLAGPLECAVDSDVAVVCEPLWDDLYEVLERMRPRPSGDDDDSGEPIEPPGCSGCEGGGAALLPLGLMVGWRRRGR